MTRRLSDRKAFRNFVNSLTEEQVREQLVLSYLQMECCNRILHGEEVLPVKMLDNGRSSDLELFYECVKIREELDAYEENEDFGDDEDRQLTFSFGVDTTGLEEGLERAREIIHDFTKSINTTINISIDDE